MTTQVIQREERAITSPTPDHMLQLAIERGADMNQLEKLMDLKERWDANEARKAFVQAMTAFKSNPPQVIKSTRVNFGTGTNYFHATLAAVCDAVVKAMSEHGLSHRWSVHQNASEITVTCWITHELGHSESTSMTAHPDDSGKKNAIQQIASTVTYLERYTLMAATGLAAADMIDDDGLAAGKAVEFINEKQVNEIQEFLDKDGDSMWEKAILKWIGEQYGATTLAEIPKDKFGPVFTGVRSAFEKRRAEREGV